MDFLQRQRLMFTEEELTDITNITVLIAGVGGLGTHQALELQRIGVGKIYLVDSDKIEPSNLNRQVLYGKEDIEELKAVKAKEVLDNFKLETKTVAITERIDEETEIPSDVDLILDALDNFKSRYKLEKLANEYKIPLVHGGVSSWYGQITTIIPGKTLTLKEIFEQEQKSDEEIPVFSPAVSVIASLQVIEGVKVVLNKKDTLKNKLLMIDLRDYSFNEIEL
ncbi:HesA/MoeB/ThiF family protein [Halanaerobaculum tunisiense]